VKIHKPEQNSGSCKFWARDQLDGKFGDIEPAENDDACGLKACSKLLLRTYMARATPASRPRPVELRVTGEIGGVPVQGHINVPAVCWT
jgi:hypothetical protein